ncbi:NAD(P)/FAD-dependent oxidoreductase [Streptomyces collinus]|uniref:NAD(P)/FAD-dependent oxidoreductase n=1 Tax=Streptomyces collinus TaxID=42684 RepID=UPI00368B8CC7
MTGQRSELIVVIGAGQAGTELALGLRREGYAGRIVLIGQEPIAPYQRPPLSKAFLTSPQTEESLWLRAPGAYDKAGIELRLATRVLSVDRAAHVVDLDDGTQLRYDKLGFATGGTARQLPGARRARNLHSLRTMADAVALRSRLVQGRRLIVIGGGFVGLEIAAAAVARGLSVTVVESQPLLMSRVTSPFIGRHMKEVHTAHGVDVRTGVGVAELTYGPDGQTVDAATLTDGSHLAADEMVAGIGMNANVTLAAEAGLAVADGITVDVHARTSDPDIVAVGDCATAAHVLLPRPVRLESVHHATEQARVAAATLCGKSRLYAAVPWFWSDQYGTSLRIAGVIDGCDSSVVRGDPACGSFSVLHFRGDTLVAVEAVNAAADFIAGRRLIQQGAAPDPDSVADSKVPLIVGSG